MIDYISKDNLHAPVIAMIAIPGLLFADDLAFSFTINSLQKTIDQVLKYCREWKLKCNLNKTKIVLCKKCGKLKKEEKWFVNDYQIEVANKINYLGIFWKVLGVGTDTKAQRDSKR
jgi:hypothetical protein